MNKDKEVIFSLNPDDEDDHDLNIMMTNTSNDPLHMHSSSSAMINLSSCITTCSDALSYWSDVVQQPLQALPPLTPLPPQSSLLREGEDQVRQLLFQHQEEKLQQGYLVYPKAELEEGGPSMNLECQVVTQGISIGGNNPGSREHNKRLKSAQSAHTVSEKKRREKFKGKIKALEELLPKCDKKDTASVLDETIKQIRLLQFQAQWLQAQYMTSNMRTISPSHITAIPSQLISTQMMDYNRPNVLGMVPYHSMLHYPAAATMIPQMQMLPMLPPRLPPAPHLLPLNPSSVVATPRATLTPSTRVITNVPREGEGGDGRLAPPSHSRQDTQ